MCRLFGNLVKLERGFKSLTVLLFGAVNICLLSSAVTTNATEKVVDFKKALSIADSTHPEIQNGLSKIRELQQRKMQIKSNLLPQVSASASYNRIGDVPQGKKYLLGNSNNDFYTDITVKQLVYAGGKYKYQISAVDTLIKNEAQRLLQIRRTVRLAVARMYFETVRAKFAAGVQRDLIQRTQSQMNIAELLFNGGKISNLDLIRLRTQVLIVQGQLITLESQVRTKQFLLSQTLGVVDTCIVADSALPENIETVTVNTAGLENELRESPELIAVQSAYQKLQLDKKSAEADYFPTVLLNAGYNLEGGAIISDQLGGITDNPNWNIGVSIHVPIYRGGGIRAQLAQADERILQARYLIDQTNLNLTSRLRTVMESINDKKEKISLAKQTLESAAETVRTAELRYATGDLSAFEMIDAQSIYARTQQDYFTSRIDYRIALEELANICPSIIKAEETLQ